MTRTEAEQLKETLKATSVFTRITVDEFGFMSGDFEVYARIENSRTGNTHVKSFSEPITEEAAHKAAREAKKAAAAKDRETISRFRADRQNQY